MSEQARLQCYAEIKECMSSRIFAYYKKHQDYLHDARSLAAIKESVEGLDCIFAILDKYDITEKKE
jgi:hypothetical protein